MRKSLRSTTSSACAHQGWVATEWRNAEGMATSIQRPKRVSNHKTALLQRRYWPRKKQRSTHQAGRKKRWPRLAGKASSSGLKTTKRNRKLMPTENARAGIFMTHHRAALAGRVAGCEAGRVAGFVLG